MRLLLLTSRHSTYGAQVINAAQTAGLTISAVIIENEPSRGGWRRIWKYIKRYGPIAVLARGLELAKHRIKGGPHRDEKVEQAVVRLSIPCETVENLNMPEALQVIRKYQPDVGLLGGTRILKQRCIALFPRGLLNAHAGILPMYRGNYGNHWALVNCDRCGLSVCLVDEGLDTGAILKTQIIDPLPGDGVVAFERRFTRIGADLLAETALSYLNGQITPTPQSPGEGTHFGFLSLRPLLKLHSKLRRIRRDAARKQQLYCAKDDARK